jgi:hypothetical protein
MAEPPPSLAGSLARIDRANEILLSLDAELKAFIRTIPYTALPQPDPNPENRKFVIKNIRDVPLRLRVFVGEVAHHLRASLDLLVYQMLTRRGITDEKRLRRCAFPILVEFDLTKPNDKREYDRLIEKGIKGISPEAHARIEALQPCIPANNGEWSHLAQVQELDNTDKHRLLLAGFASTRLRNFSFHDVSGGVRQFPEAFVPLQEDAVFIFSRVPPGAVVSFDFATDITFNEPGPVFGKPIVHILQNLSSMTRVTVESFADCL